MKPTRSLLVAAAMLLVSLTVRLAFGSDAPALNVRVHNGLAAAPAAIAFVVNDEAAFVVDIGRARGTGSQANRKRWPSSRPGTASPDDSIHQISWEPPEANIHWTWGRVGDAAVGRLLADKPTAVALTVLKETWPGFTNTVATAADGASGEAVLKDGRKITWSLATSAASTSHSDDTLMLALEPAKPVIIVAGFGKLPEFGQVDAILERAGRAYLARRPAAHGEWGDFVGAIADNLNNSRVYSTDNHVLAHTVCRGWAKDPNTAPYFCWDSFFNAALACLDDPDTAKDTVRAILAFQTAEGMVPNIAHVFRNGSVGKYSSDRSQPPVGAMCVWKMNQRRPDKAFLAEVYPKLKKWHAWWLTARDGNHDGLLEWGSNEQAISELKARKTTPLQAARLETGWDDTLHFESAKMVGSTMNVYAVDLNALWSMDAEYLALIADALGEEREAALFRTQHSEMNRKINEMLWNEDLGLYCSRLWDDTGKPGPFLTRLTPMNFYPLICGAPDADRGARVLKVLTDPKRFWGQWKLPTLAYDDPSWPQQAYWRGNVWPPVNYLVFQGLKRYASPELRNEFARSSVDLFMRNWTSNGACGENYHSTDGNQAARRSDRHYTWGALLCLIGIEAIVDQTNDGRIITAVDFNEDLGLRNIPLDGRLYQVHVHDGRAVVTPQN